MQPAGINWGPATVKDFRTHSPDALFAKKLFHYFCTMKFFLPEGGEGLHPEASARGETQHYTYQCAHSSQATKASSTMPSRSEMEKETFNF